MAAWAKDEIAPKDAYRVRHSCDVHGPFPGSICPSCAEGFAFPAAPLLSPERSPRQTVGPELLLEVAEAMVQQATLLATLAKAWHEKEAA